MILQQRNTCSGQRSGSSRKTFFRHVPYLNQLDFGASRIHSRGRGKGNQLGKSSSSSLTSLSRVNLKNEKGQSLAARACWLLVVSLCTVGCLIQIGERVWTYFRTPVKLEISIERNNSITYPAITVCPDYNMRIDKINNLHIRHCKENVDPTVNCLNQTIVKNTSYTKLNLSTDLINSMEAVNAEDINVTAPCFKRLNAQSDLGVSFPTTKSKLWTYWGQCIVVIPDKPVQFRGTSTRMTLKLNRPAVQILYHSQHILHRHEAFFFAIPVRNRRASFLILSAKQFTFENTRENPCIGETESELCRTRCIDKKVSENPNIRCRIPPLTNESLPQCRNQAEAQLSIEALEQTYINMTSDECICTRKCQEFIYTASIEENIDRNQTGIILHVVYPDNVYELMKEVYSYSITALVSDIGGSLGFYLGVCVLQVFEFLQGLYRNFSPGRCSYNK